MGKPRHRRCDVCNAVTARYRGTVRQGAVFMAVWERDPQHGEQVTSNGQVVRCAKHAVVPRADLVAARAAELEHRRGAAPDETTARQAADELHALMDDVANVAELPERMADEEA